jgi:glycosyltransferase involved in cell wall biosynthesis
MEATVMVEANKHPRFRQGLGVIGAAPHWVDAKGVMWAYEPYVREMRVWADLFSTVEICGWPGEGAMYGNLASYDRANIAWRSVPYTYAVGYRAAIKRLWQLPGLIVHAYRTIKRNDIVLLRSPGHFGLVGAVLVRLMRKRSITKWAGENGAFKGERLPSRFERFLQGIPNDLHPMLVYGPPQRRHQLSFIPALMSKSELDVALESSRTRVWSPPWNLLAVGRLHPAKGFDLAIEGLAELHRIRPRLDWTFTLVGDGGEMETLRDRARRGGISSRVRFPGAMPFSEVQKCYAGAHIVIMPGTKEGWPKIIAESWAHGAVPVAAAAGLVPWILSDSRSGVTFEPNATALAHALSSLLEAPDTMKDMSRGLYAMARDLSLDAFKERLEAVLVDRCGLR